MTEPAIEKSAEWMKRYLAERETTPDQDDEDDE